MSSSTQAIYRQVAAYDAADSWTDALGGALGFVRLGLAASFLSAVADRFGLWGKAGEPGVAWGDWGVFLEYVAVLNWFAPESAIPWLGGIATLAEILLAVALLVGWKLRWSAMAAGLLLGSFGLTMAMASGIKGPLDYSVFSAAGGAFLLAAVSSRRRRPPQAAPSRFAAGGTRPK